MIIGYLYNIWYVHLFAVINTSLARFCPSVRVFDLRYWGWCISKYFMTTQSHLWGTQMAKLPSWYAWFISIYFLNMGVFWEVAATQNCFQTPGLKWINIYMRIRGVGPCLHRTSMRLLSWTYSAAPVRLAAIVLVGLIFCLASGVT